MVKTNVPPIGWTPQGFQLPPEPEILAGVQADINAAFGGGVNPHLSTPQGQIAQSETAVIGSKNGDLAYLAAMLDPDSSEGRWQDALGRIYFIERNAGFGTTVAGQVNGLGGTKIPAGTRVQDTSGETYTLNNTVTIPYNGTIGAVFTNVNLGPIPCPAGTLTTIVDSIPGWDKVNNREDGVLGANTESRVDFESRRRDAVSVGGLNSVSSVRGAVLSVPGVIACYAIDNPLGETVSVGVTEYKMKPHSIYVAVVGGTPGDVSRAIWNKKPAGCNYNGSTSAKVVDVTYPDPKPTYTVYWQIPKNVALNFKVVIVDSPSLPADIVERVQEIVLSYFNGELGALRAGIGVAIYSSSYYGPVTSVDLSVNVNSITLGKGASASATSVTMGIDEYPTLSLDDIVVTLSDA